MMRIEAGAVLDAASRRQVQDWLCLFRSCRMRWLLVMLSRN
jgi:hypothetical protein